MAGHSELVLAQANLIAWNLHCHVRRSDAHDSLCGLELDLDIVTKPVSATMAMVAREAAGRMKHLIDREGYSLQTQASCTGA